MHGCDYHHRTGHSTEQCQAKLKDPDYIKYQESQRTSAPPRAIAVRVHKVSTGKPNTWIYDTACTDCMTDEAKYLHNYSEFKNPILVYGVGDSNILYALGSGTAHLQSHAGSSTHMLKNVWYVPGLGESIISRHWTRANGLITSLDEDENIILACKDPSSNFKVISQSIDQITVFPSLSAIPNKSVQVYAVATTSALPALPAPSVASTPETAKDNHINDDHLWHERFLHASADRISKHIPNHERITCEPCILGKQSRSPFKQVEDKVADKLARVYIDHCGPVTPTTYGNGKYALNLRDEATSYTWTYVVPDRTAKTIINVLKAWKSMVENQAGTTPQGYPH